MKTILWIFGILFLLIILYVIYRLATATEKRYSDFGRSDWFPNGNTLPAEQQNKVGFISDVPHQLSVGDSVLITQAPGFTYAAYNGEAKVIAILSDKIFITDKAFAGTTQNPQPGVYQRTNIF